MSAEKPEIKTSFITDVQQGFSTSTSPITPRWFTSIASFTVLLQPNDWYHSTRYLLRISCCLSQDVKYLNPRSQRQERVFQAKPWCFPEPNQSVYTALWRERNRKFNLNEVTKKKPHKFKWRTIQWDLKSTELETFWDFLRICRHPGHRVSCCSLWFTSSALLQRILLNLISDHKQCAVENKGWSANIPSDVILVQINIS